MGQQQLLLVILVTILVGIATVVAINVFGTAADQANRDAVRQDLLAAAAQAQAIYARPQMMGGAGGDFGFLDESDLLGRLNIPGALGDVEGEADQSQITNENGVYTIAVTRGGDGIRITAVPTSDTEDIALEVYRENSIWNFDWDDEV